MSTTTAAASHLVLEGGRAGEVYNIGGGTELTNKELTGLLLEAAGAGWEPGRSRSPTARATTAATRWTSAKISGELGYTPEVAVRARVARHDRLVPRQPGLVAAAEAGDGRLMRWLVLGCRGQLGSDLMDCLAAAGTRRRRTRLPRGGHHLPRLRGRCPRPFRPDVVVNAAAYTAVDAAEDDEEAALAVNGHGPARPGPARSPASPGARLVHVSTDYVFPGDADRALRRGRPDRPPLGLRPHQTRRRAGRAG